MNAWYPSCAEQALSFLQSPRLIDHHCGALGGVEQIQTYLADNENEVVVPTTTRVIFDVYVRDLYCCTQSGFDFFRSDWHPDNAEGEWGQN